jgi:hypothetical protein
MKVTSTDLTGDAALRQMWSDLASMTRPSTQTDDKILIDGIRVEP